MTGLIERIARIIYPEAFGLPEPDRSGELSGYLTGRDEARARARAAIASMREPSATARVCGVMDDMVDRVARALFSARFSSDDYNSRLFAEARKVCLRDAILMIAAMREPTESMMTTATEFRWDDCDVGCDTIWHAMIDAALGKPGGDT